MSCCLNTSQEFVNILEKDCNQFNYGANESNHLECSAFQINYPVDWEFVIEASKNDSTFVFSEKIDKTDNLDLTDELYEIKYNNFQTISLTFGKKYETLNYDAEFETVYQQISENKYNKIKESGTALFDKREAKWIIYDDESYLSENLICESLTTCVTNSKYYVWIIIQTFGDYEFENRKCKAMEILKTLELKV